MQRMKLKLNRLLLPKHFHTIRQPLPMEAQNLAAVISAAADQAVVFRLLEGCKVEMLTFNSTQSTKSNPINLKPIYPV
jgi:hypothetical protein